MAQLGFYIFAFFYGVILIKYASQIAVWRNNRLCAKGVTLKQSDMAKVNSVLGIILTVLSLALSACLVLKFFFGVAISQNFLEVFFLLTETIVGINLASYILVLFVPLIYNNLILSIVCVYLLAGILMSVFDLMCCL